MNYYQGARRSQDNPMAVALAAEQTNLQISEKLAERSQKELDDQVRYQQYLSEAFAKISDAELPGPSKQRLIEREKKERQIIIDKLKEYGGDVRKFFAYGGSAMVANYMSNIKSSQEWNDGIQSKVNERLIAEQIVAQGLVPHRVKVNIDGDEREIPLEDAIAAYNGQHKEFKLDALPYAGGFQGADSQKIMQYVNGNVNPWASIEQRMNGEAGELHPDQLKQILKQQNFADWYVEDYVKNYRDQYFGKATKDSFGRSVPANPFVWKTDDEMYQLGVRLREAERNRQLRMELAGDKSKTKVYVGFDAGLWLRDQGAAVPSAIKKPRMIEPAATSDQYAIGTVSWPSNEGPHKSIQSVPVESVRVMIDGKLVPLNSPGKTDSYFGTQGIQGYVQSGNVSPSVFQMMEAVSGDDNLIMYDDNTYFVKVNLRSNIKINVNDDLPKPVRDQLKSQLITTKHAGQANADKDYTDLYNVWVPLTRPSNQTIMDKTHQLEAGLNTRGSVIDDALN